ncbi:hypothetical protein ES703_124504 [subsurface metagenome]
MLTEQAIQEFMTSRGGLRPKTQQEYRNHLVQFQWFFPDLPTTPQPVQSWLNGLQREKGNPGQELAPETIHSRFRTIRAFYRQIHLWHPKIRNPMPLVRPPHVCMYLSTYSLVCGLPALETGFFLLEIELSVVKIGLSGTGRFLFL